MQYSRWRNGAFGKVTRSQQKYVTQVCFDEIFVSYGGNNTLTNASDVKQFQSSFTPIILHRPNCGYSFVTFILGYEHDVHLPVFFG